jgi:hypothetical protein
MKHLFVVVLAASTGCVVHTQTNTDPQPSGGSDVAQMQASFSAQSDGQTIQVYTALMNGGFLTLSDGDALTASLDGAAPVKLLESRDGNTVHYVGSFAQPKDKATVAIALSRSGKTGAPASSVELPPFFTVTEPLPAQIAKVGAIPIRLTGYTQYYAAIEVKGACVQNGDAHVAFQLDPNQHADVPVTQIPFANLATFPCDVDVFVRSELQGKVDPAFKGGSFEGLEQLALKTTITP